MNRIIITPAGLLIAELGFPPALTGSILALLMHRTGSREIDKLRDLFFTECVRGKGVRSLGGCQAQIVPQLGAIHPAF
jgi:hypothetical protein